MSKYTSKEVLSNWFRQWRSPLREFLIAKGAARSADLDDIGQEVFLRLMRYERVELVEQPKAYLFKMAANVAAEWSIRARHSRPHDSKWLADLLTEDQPEDDHFRRAAQDEIQRALDTLVARQREALKLQFIEGLRHEQIAERLGVSKRSVKRILMLSYQKLREELDPELLGVIARGRG